MIFSWCIKALIILLPQCIDVLMLLYQCIEPTLLFYETLLHVQL